MNKLSFKLKNCFGIVELGYSFNISKDNNVVMIYAPNGTMKTSLARTFLCLENNHNAADLIDETKKSSYSFLLDEEIIKSNQIYVYKTEDNQIEPNGISRLEDDNILSFISSPKEVKLFKELLAPIDSVINQINKRFNKLVKYGEYNIQDEILDIFKYKGILAKYNSIDDAIIEAKDFNASECEFTDIFYDELFDKHGTSAKYVKKYYSELTNLNERGSKKISVGRPERWNRVCEIVDSYPYIKAKINDIESLRKDFILSFIKNEMELFLELDILYKDRKKELINIINKVDADTHLWNQVISIFYKRFSVPYQIQLVNRAESILEQAFLHLKYINKVKGEYKSKEHFLNFISTGEKRAYYLLVNLFEIEKRKRSNEKQIIVFDDIVESFDYKNKYAIVEYLAELKECKNFILVILTHNFDFYRTVHSRLNVSNIYIANRDSRGCITLSSGNYVRDILKNVLIRNINTPKYLIALIPFVRNIVEYTKGVQSKDYCDLTNYLHFKPQTKSLLMRDLSELVLSNIYMSHKTRISGSNHNYLETLYDETEKVLCSDDIIAIENKLILTMAIRLRTERFILIELNDKIDVNPNVHINQTRFLFDKYIQFFPENNKQHDVLRKVLMLTSENIHINNFMFEPIIDLSIGYLKDLYREVKDLK